MNNVNNLLGIFLLWLIIVSPFQKDINYNKSGRPSKDGIIRYIENNEQSLIHEYEYKVDTIYDVNIYTDDLGGEDENSNLGEFYLPDYVVLTNRERYVAYEFKELTKYRQITMSFRERTVKAVLFHELSHVYFHQIMTLMQNDSIHVAPEYSVFRPVVNPTTQFSTEFIEEGTCEYIVYKLKECMPPEEIEIPQTPEQLYSPYNKVNNLYIYSYHYVKPFLDEHGLKEGIQILLRNKPPTTEEMLKPKLFFNRLK